MKAAVATLRWWIWLALGQWRAAPGRTLVSIVAVAIGVALALAIHLVNASALEEFRQAIATINGEAHAQVRADAAQAEARAAELQARTAQQMFSVLGELKGTISRGFLFLLEGGRGRNLCADTQ
jgi:putative ABC transport system permease protein